MVVGLAVGFAFWVIESLAWRLAPVLIYNAIYVVTAYILYLRRGTDFASNGLELYYTVIWGQWGLLLPIFRLAWLTWTSYILVISMLVDGIASTFWFGAWVTIYRIKNEVTKKERSWLDNLLFD